MSSDKNSNTEFFSKSKPNLINSKILKDINKTLDVPYNKPTNIFTNTCSRIYHNYICPNAFPLILIILIMIFLLVRYMLKKNKKKNTKKIINRQYNYPNSYQKPINNIHRDYTYDDFYKSQYLPDDLVNTDNSDDFINDEYSIDDKLESTSDIDSQWSIKNELNNDNTLQDNSNELFSTYGDANYNNNPINYGHDENKAKFDNLAKQMFSKEN